MSIRKGKDGGLYISATPLTADTQAASATAVATATLYENVADVTSDLTKDNFEVNSRANKGWKRKVTTLKDGSIKFKVIFDDEDTIFQLLLTAFLDDAPLAAWDLDSVDRTVGQGLAGNFEVQSISRGGPLDNAYTFDVELSPAGKQHWFNRAD